MTSQIETSRIAFSDGRRGTQRVEILEDGQRILREIVVTQNDLGHPCRHVYADPPDLKARVYSLSDLGGRVSWSILPGSVRVTG